jgi:hypothetical protein
MHEAASPAIERSAEANGRGDGKKRKRKEEVLSPQEEEDAANAGFQTAGILGIPARR